MMDGDYVYEFEANDTGERHRFEVKGGTYLADGIEQTDPIMQCLMDAALDLLVEQRHLTEHLNALMVCDDCSPHIHPGSGRSH